VPSASPQVSPPPPAALTIRGATGECADLGSINGRFELLPEGFEGRPAWQRTTMSPRGDRLWLARRSDVRCWVGSVDDFKISRQRKHRGFLCQRTPGSAHELPTALSEWEVLVGYGRWEHQVGVVVEAEGRRSGPG